MKYLFLMMVLVACADDPTFPGCPKVTCTETQVCTINCDVGQTQCPMKCEPKKVCTVDPNEVPAAQ